MNTFVVFLSRVIGYAVDSFLRKNDEQSSGPGHRLHGHHHRAGHPAGLLAAIIVAWFSRQREFRADAGAAQLMGRKQPMINALYRLGGMHCPARCPRACRAMGIAGGIGKLFSSHRHRGARGRAAAGLIFTPSFTIPLSTSDRAFAGAGACACALHARRAT